jgi:hypothetical protein
MRASIFLKCLVILCITRVYAQVDDSDARPPVAKTDIEIVKRAAQILDSPQKWNRTDNRVCPSDARTFSLYCALEKATDEVTKTFEHRGAAMQEARFIIEEIAPGAKGYDHRLMDYNNDPNTSFADIQGVFWLLEKHIAMRLADPQSAPPTAVPAALVTKADLQVAKRLFELFDTPEKWNRTDAECVANAKSFSLLCAFEKVEKEVTGSSDDGGAIREARAMISELDPDRSKYKARLADYNSDPSVSFADLQKFIHQLEDRLTARLPKE